MIAQNMKKISVTILFLVIIFSVGFSVWYSPVAFKGYAPYKISELVPIAKNIYKAGNFSLENSQNVFLASSLVDEKGEIATSGNKLTAYLYAQIFKIAGLMSPHELVIFSIIANLLSLLVFAFIVLYLFGFKIAGLFSLVYILIPFNWLQVYSLGTYEFAVFFLALFSLFFLLGREKKHEAVFMFIAGIFLALAALSREVFFLLILIIPVYFWFSQGRKLIVYLLAPIILILSIFYFPALIKENGINNYAKHFFADSDNKEQFSDFNFYSHLYPDAYTYHFERGEFLESYNKKIENTGFLRSLEMKKSLVNLGERSMKPHERFFLGVFLLISHLSRFVSLELIGGPFILFFSLLGLFYLKEKDKQLYKFSIYWVLGTLFLLSFVVLVSRSHLKDFSWLMPFLTALGIFYLLEIFKEKLNLSDGKNMAFLVFLSFILLYSLLVADHVVFGKLYDEPASLKMESYAREAVRANISDNDVIALGLNSKEIVTLNYLTDKSMVVFTEETLKKIIEQNKLREVFENFGVRYILGYSDGFSSVILERTGVSNLASNSIEIRLQDVSPLKSMFMGLVR